MYVYQLYTFTKQEPYFSLSNNFLNKVLYCFLIHNDVKSNQRRTCVYNTYVSNQTYYC